MFPIKSKLKITYLLETTELWGGVKVVFEQAEALSESGFDVKILSKDSKQSWYPLKLPVTEVREFNDYTIPESDIVIGTYWTTVKEAYPTKKGILVHLCQGYEGGNKELQHLKKQIDNVYKLNIPKLTISPHLNKFIQENFRLDSYYIGQMINREIFYPSNTEKDINKNNNLKILVVGPFEADVKNIQTSLQGIAIAKNNMKIPIILIRVSQFPLTNDEKNIFKPDNYYYLVPYESMGNIYRNADLLISMSKEAEGFGLPPLEAMACGVPTILSKIPAHLFYDSEHNYALFCDSNAESIAHAIFKIYSDSSLRKNIIINGLRITNKFNKEIVLERLHNAFNKILKIGKNFYAF